MGSQLYQTFSRAEHFYYDQFWGYLIVGLLLLFFWIIMLLYGRRKERWVATVLVWAYVLPVSIWLGGAMMTYQPMITLTSRITASVRDYYRVPYSTIEYSFFEKSAYRNHFLPQTFEGLEMYRMETLEEPVTYLGSDRNYGYIELNGETYKLDKGFFKTCPTTNSAKREGIQYVLTDAQFQDLGFIPQTRIFLSKIFIPDSQATLEVAQDVANGLKETKDVLATWVVE